MVSVVENVTHTVSPIYEYTINSYLLNWRYLDYITGETLNNQNEYYAMFFLKTLQH